MKKPLTCLLFSAALVLGARPVLAQSRPLVTQDPETVPAGNVLFETGLQFDHGIVYPASGLTGNLTRILPLGFSVGVSPVTELEVGWGLHDSLSVSKINAGAPLAGLLNPAIPAPTTTTSASTSDVENYTIGAKIRLLAETETRPAFSVRFWTQLPGAGPASGLGLGTTEFHAGIAVGKTVRSVRFVLNGGFGVLPDPASGGVVNNVLDYGASVARAVAPGTEIVGEFNGRLNPGSTTPAVGTESRAVMRLGGRYTRGQVRVDAALLIGVTDLDQTWGFTTGLTYVFKAFSLP